MRVLVAEDEQDLNRIITETLEDEGFSVDSCFNGAEALDYISLTAYDALVLDILMPKMDGLQLVKTIRSRGNSVPVLFLTAKDTVEDKVTGLDSGGDYYLTKPFSFDELVAVVRAISRKYSGNKTTVYTVADLTLDTASKTVTRGGKVISLSVKEFSLLEYMLRNPGIVLSREMIENNCWSYDYEGGSNLVDVYVSYLRKKIDSGFDTKLIHTVWGAGWVLRED